MSVETALVTLVGDVAAVAGRVYPLRLPAQASLPAVVYQRISGARTYSHHGQAGGVAPRFQLACWAKRYSEARTTADAVRRKLTGYRGTVDDVRIDGIMIVNEIDRHEAESDLYRVLLDAIVQHEEH